MKYYIYSTIFIIIASVLFSCSYDLTLPQEVKKLEVLAVKTDKPEVHPGDIVNAEVLIGKPENNQEEYHTMWILCNPNNDGRESTAFSACMDPKMSDLIGNVSVDSDIFTVKIPEDILNKGDYKTKYLYILHILCKADEDTCISEADSTKSDENPFKKGIYHLTLKRIKVVDNDIEIKNIHNPKIKAVYLNDEEIDFTSEISLKNDEDNTFKVEIDSDSFDKMINNKGEEVYETVSVAWKSNAGEFSYYYTNQSKDETLSDFDENPFDTPDGEHSYKIYLIATDSLGGIDWKIIKVNGN